MRFHTRKWVKPEDLNPHGTLFGGQLLAWIDEEAALYTIIQLENPKVVTKYISEINFNASAKQGDIVEIGPGQAVFTYPPEKHRVEAVGDESAVMFLTVTPHQQPTHTHYDEHGKRLPTRVGVTDPTWMGQPAAGPLT